MNPINSKKRKIESYIETLDLHNFIDCHIKNLSRNKSISRQYRQLTPQQLIELIKVIQEKYKNRDIYFVIKEGGYDGGYEIELYENRLETDEEYNSRLKLEAKKIQSKLKAEEKRTKKEKEDYKRLKKKFG